MKKLFIILIPFFCLLFFSENIFGLDDKTAAGYPQTLRSKVSLNMGWKFHLGDIAGAGEAEFDDSGWETINVPHSLKLTSLALDHVGDDKNQLTFHRYVAWYRRVINIDDPDKKTFIEFEGAHQVTDLWVNGQHVGQHAIGGYTPFHFDISDFVRQGENSIALRLDNRRREDTPPDPGPFDYVKFGGLYRDVYLVQTGPVFVTFPWEDFFAGVFVTTPTVDLVNRNATISVRTTVRNESDQVKDIRLLTRIIDGDGMVVLRFESAAQVRPGGDYTFHQTGGIEENLHLWSVDNPYLYRVNSLVFDGESAVDCIENPLGIRKFELDRERGFLLNGEPVELIGMNRHQHYPFIGDAVPNSLHYKDVWQFKQYGFNIIRTAHYPQDNALLEACDRLGLLVYEEPPTWISIGNDAWFDNLERAARRMVRNHRNHPSVVVWGAGINHRGYVPRLHYAIKEEDPTRWTGSNNAEWTGWQTSGLCDLFTNMDYDGITDWSGKEPLLAMEGRRFEDCVVPYTDDPLKLGIISWTAYDYYTFHPSKEPDYRMRSGGLMDGFRTPNKRMEWYRAELTREPMVVIDGQWKQGVENIRVYSNCDEVELLANGKTIGKQQRNPDPKYRSLQHPPLVFEIENYQDGELIARGYIDGTLAAEDRVKTPEQPLAVSLYIDTEGRSLTADGSDIVMAYASIVDRNGTIIEDTPTKIRFSVTGPASIVGDGLLPDANPAATRKGKAAVLVRAGTEPGKIQLTAAAPGLRPASATVTSVTYNPDVISASAAPIFDMEKISVDIGGEGQLLQFDWIPWNGRENQPATKQFSQLGGFTASLESGSEDGRIFWLGEMNVKGFHGYVMGEGVCAVDPDGFKLVLNGLEAGRYTLTTFHHAPQSNTNSMDPNREKLKTLSINNVAMADRIQISHKDWEKIMPVTLGKILPPGGPTTAVLEFQSDGKEPVVFQFKDPDGMRGLWLNGFELIEMPELTININN